MPGMEQVSLRDLGIFVAICCLAIPQVIALANFGLDLVGKPRRREMSFPPEFATKAEVHALSVDLADLKSSIVTNGESRRVAIEAKVERAREEAKADAEALRNEVGELATSVARVEETARMLNQTMSQLALRGSGRERSGY